MGARGCNLSANDMNNCTSMWSSLQKVLTLFKKKHFLSKLAKLLCRLDRWQRRPLGQLKMFCFIVAAVLRSSEALAAEEIQMGEVGPKCMSTWTIQVNFGSEPLAWTEGSACVCKLALLRDQPFDWTIGIPAAVKNLTCQRFNEWDSEDSHAKCALLRCWANLGF